VLPRNLYIDCLRLLILVALFAFVPQVTALQWGPLGGPDNYTPARHNPFLQDPAFIAPTLDLSGVGQYHIYVPGFLDNYFWVTMISDTYYITTLHTMGAYFDDHDIHFYHDNNPIPAEIVAIDDTYHTVLRDDVWIGRLKSAPSIDVKRYPLIMRPEDTNWAGIPGIDTELFLVGDRAGEGGEAQSRLGLNDISHHYLGDLYFTYDFNQRGVDEVRTQCCDSSASSFVANPYADFALAGLHHVNQDVNISSLAGEIAAEVYNASGGTESVTVVTDLAGDLNNDFKVDQIDRNILLGNLGNGPGMRHVDGDINGDGYVNNVDFTALESNLNKTLSAPADFNSDFAVNKTDMLAIGNHWHSVAASHADGDANGDGHVDAKDFDLLNASYLPIPWSAPTPISPVPGDLTHDGLVDNDDSTILLSCITSSCSPQDFDRSDINNDNLVDSNDLQILLSNWDPTGPADINNDLKINNSDIAVLFGNWGKTTTLGKAAGDLNLDGIVDVNDYAILTDWWGRGVSDFAAQPPLASQPLPGDFNADGTVDAADYVVWRKNPGGFPVDAYATWQSHFGQSPGNGASGVVSANVPEPATFVLLVVAVACVSARRRVSNIKFHRCASSK
jgi:hypothetical protein